MSHDQLLMAFLEDEAKKPAAAAGADVPPAADTTPAKQRARRVSKLSASLKGLPTTVREIVDPAVLAAPDDYRLIGEETSERLHVSPAAFTVEIIKRLTHVLKRDPDAVPITPPLEPCLLPGSILTPSLGAYLLTQKFCYHSPFYREEWKLRAAYGIELTRNLMRSWHDHLAELLAPLYQLIAAGLRTASYVKVDETPVRCLEPGKGKTALGSFWVYHHAEHGVLLDWHKSRGNDCLDKILIGKDGESSFSGYLQSDALRAYCAFIARHPELGIVPVSCLAHIRRKFFEARDDHPRVTATSQTGHVPSARFGTNHQVPLPETAAIDPAPRQLPGHPPRGAGGMRQRLGLLDHGYRALGQRSAPLTGVRYDSLGGPGALGN